MVTVQPPRTPAQPTDPSPERADVIAALRTAQVSLQFAAQILGMVLASETLIAALQLELGRREQGATQAEAPPASPSKPAAAKRRPGRRRG